MRQTRKTHPTSLRERPLRCTDNWIFWSRSKCKRNQSWETFWGFTSMPTSNRWCPTASAAFSIFRNYTHSLLVFPSHGRIFLGPCESDLRPHLLQEFPQLNGGVATVGSDREGHAATVQEDVNHNIREVARDLWTAVQYLLVVDEGKQRHQEDAQPANTHAAKLYHLERVLNYSFELEYHQTFSWRGVAHLLLSFAGISGILILKVLLSCPHWEGYADEEEYQVSLGPQFSLSKGSASFM